VINALITVKLGVYNSEEISGKNRPVVTNPNNCVVLCEGCPDICPSGAIIHPSRKRDNNGNCFKHPCSKKTQRSRIQV